MRRTFLAGLMLALLNGCKSPEDNAVSQQKAALETLATDLATVNDLPGMKQVMGEYAKSRAALLEVIRAVPRDQAGDFSTRINRALEPSRDKVLAALQEARDRLLRDKTHPQVLLKTSMGTVTIELFEGLAPVTVGNFLKHVKDKHYDGTIFHLVANFKVQGGGFDPHMQEKVAGKPIANEADNGLINDRGSVAMARTQDSNSDAAQFFVNLKSNTFLNRVGSPDGVGCAVFGKVIDGMDVMDRIGKVDTDTIALHENVPVKPVTIVSIGRVEMK